MEELSYLMSVGGDVEGGKKKNLSFFSSAPKDLSFFSCATSALCFSIGKSCLGELE